MLVSGGPLTDGTATRAIKRIWRAGVLCDRRAFVASAAEAEELDAFDAQVAKVPQRPIRIYVRIVVSAASLPGR